MESWWNNPLSHLSKEKVSLGLVMVLFSSNMFLRRFLNIFNSQIQPEVIFKSILQIRVPNLETLTPLDIQY